MLASPEQARLALENDRLSVLPQFRADYVDVEELVALAENLVSPHLAGGKSSLTHQAHRVLNALRLANREHGLEEGNGERAPLVARETNGGGGGGGGTFGVTTVEAEEAAAAQSRGTAAPAATHEPEDIARFHQAFRFQARRVEGIYLADLGKMEAALDDLAKFCESVLASKGAKGLSAKRGDLLPQFEVLFRRAHHIESYALTNYSMCSHVLQLPKVAARRWGASWLGQALKEEELDPLTFTAAEGVRALQSKVAQCCAELFFDADEAMARHRLLRKNRDLVDWEMVVVGAWIGAALMASAWALYSVYGPAPSAANPGAGGVPAAVLEAKAGGLRVFRATGLILTMFWGFGVQVAMWREARVNFPIIFGIRPELFPPTSTLFVRASEATVVYLLCLVAFVRSESGVCDVIPLLVLVLFLASILRLWYLLVLRWERGRSGLSTAARSARRLAIFVLGVSERTFLVGYVSAYLTSSTKILAEFARIGCNIFVRGDKPEPFLARFSTDSEYCAGTEALEAVVVPVLMCWPLWLRLGQNLSRLYDTGSNWPFLFNACKYALAHTITIFVTLHPELLSPVSGQVDPAVIAIFVFAFVCTTFVTFLWDVFVDWGLGDTSRAGLREVLLFEPRRSFYYAAIAGDLVLRFMWTLQLVPNLRNHRSLLLSTGFTTALEVGRRTVWGALRVENEMLSNTHQYSGRMRSKTRAGAGAEFVPLYFETPFNQAAEASSGGASQAARKRVKAEIALLLGIVALFAAAAIVTHFVLA